MLQEESTKVDPCQPNSNLIWSLSQGFTLGWGQGASAKQIKAKTGQYKQQESNKK